MPHTTITAIATYPAQSAIGIIRVSGPSVFPILEKIFRFKTPTKTFASTLGHTLHYGFLYAEGKDIDEVLVSVFKAPASFTGEDMAEISCHGGLYVLSLALELLLSAGCCLAAPGEFTKRAFINGKIDLSQAEAVADMISADSAAALEIALNQLKGFEKNVVTTLRKEFLHIISLVEAEIDFAHEDIEKTKPIQMTVMLTALKIQLEKLMQNAEAGIILKNGAKVVIAGKPNTGKSSLLNALLGTQRAIVTHIPGTTRDIIEAPITLAGLPCRLIDTAGIRDTRDIIEAEGITRAQAAIAGADAVLFILDASAPLDINDTAIYKTLSETKFIPVLNKTDLPTAFDSALLNTLLGKNASRVIKISALKNEGLDALTLALKNIIIPPTFSSASEVLISSMRHRECLKTALIKTTAALKSLTLKIPLEFTATDIKAAAEALGSIIGEVTPEEVLGNIFKNFCVGK